GDLAKGAHLPAPEAPPAANLRPDPKPAQMQVLRGPIRRAGGPDHAALGPWPMAKESQVLLGVLQDAADLPRWCGGRMLAAFRRRSWLNGDGRALAAEGVQPPHGPLLRHGDHDPGRPRRVCRQIRG